MSASQITVEDASAILERLERANVEVWVDGGWGVDALIGEQTRSHADIDLALDRESLSSARRALQGLGFKHDETSKPGLPARLVMRDGNGRQVDLHPLVFDETGDGWQQLSDTGRNWGRYPSADLTAEGLIAGRKVRCLSPGLQFRFRLGYEPEDNEKHDLALLAERFGAGPLPSQADELRRDLMLTVPCPPTAVL